LFASNLPLPRTEFARRDIICYFVDVNFEVSINKKMGGTRVPKLATAPER
jgi:hypothetical protein